MFKTKVLVVNAQLNPREKNDRGSFDKDSPNKQKRGSWKGYS